MPSRPHSPQKELDAQNKAAAPPLHTLLVRSSRPIGEQFLGAGSPRAQFPCTKIADDVYEAPLPSLVTPSSSVPGSSGQKRIRYAILEWNPLLDSSNIDLDDWIRIATEIELNYAQFDAFVVLHGTDTMSYTSSALSFMLEDLGKTVVITGAQIPLSQLRNDAVENLMGALTIAGHLIIPECSVYFNHTLYRGNRVTKVSSYDLSAFSSPNFAPLVNVGIDIVVNWNNVIRQTSLKRFRAFKHMDAHVATLRLFPGITAASVSAFMVPSVRGVVLETFGAGNAPQRQDLMDALKQACDRGVVIVAISQCAKGSVTAAYATGKTLLAVGIVPGGDMTPECALTKLSYLLSKSELSTADVRRLMSSSIRGELTMPGPPPTDTAILDDSEKATDKHKNQALSFILSRLTQLSTTGMAPPGITVSSPNSKSQETASSTAPWTWTAAELASTESVLLPIVIHLAAAKNDVAAIRFCLQAESAVTLADPSSSAPISSLTAPPPVPNGGSVGIGGGGGGGGGIPGGVVNCLEAGSGRSPLHVAALNGCRDAVGVLLESGALVHLRDALGHTALYYAARQGHVGTVDVLMQAGAILGGFDADGGFVTLAVRNAGAAGDVRAVEAWRKISEAGEAQKD